jgi:hypothetical protein
MISDSELKLLPQLSVLQVTLTSRGTEQRSIWMAAPELAQVRAEARHGRRFRLSAQCRRLAAEHMFEHVQFHGDPDLLDWTQPGPEHNRDR